MEFEFIPDSGFDFLTSFSREFTLPIQDDTFVIPPELGQAITVTLSCQPCYVNRGWAVTNRKKF